MNREKQEKQAKKLLFCYVNSIPLESNSIGNARLWSKTHYLLIFFDTIDSYLQYKKGKNNYKIYSVRF